MTLLVLPASALVLIPYEPSYDCLKAPPPSRPVVWIEVRGDSDIRWDSQRITRDEFETYLEQERARAPEERDAFKVSRDDAGSKVAADIIRELKDAQIPFAKNCFPVP
jgi:hypothetical protein